MMNKEKILKEGLLEHYVLGTTDPSILDELEQVIENDQELRSRLEELESDFERMAQENAMEPPGEIKAALMASIAGPKTDSAPIPLKPHAYKAWFTMAAAASVILFLNTIFLIVQNGDIKEELSALKTESEELKEEQKTIRSAYNSQGEMLAFLSHPETEQYVLLGNEKQPTAKLVSYVNHQDKTVMVNTTQLTGLDKEHDYQMWADVEGEMINMGLINLEQPLIAMNYIDDAESLNVTIEPKGGSDHPTVSRLISNVYLN